MDNYEYITRLSSTELCFDILNVKVSCDMVLKDLIKIWKKETDKKNIITFAFKICL